MRDINELNVIGETGDYKRVETKDEAQSCQEVVVRYPRNASDLSADERARFASLAAKGLAHLGFTEGNLNEFVQGKWAEADAEASASSEPTADCEGRTVTIDGVTYVLNKA